MNLRDHTSVKSRREALEKELSVDLKNIGSFSLDESIASTRNCENMIGAAQIPLGVAGPLTLLTPLTPLTPRNHYVPLATTEGALVASVNRGCRVIGQSGGAQVRVTRVGTTRGPVFQIQDMTEGNKLHEFLRDTFSTMQDIAATTSNHITLLGYTDQMVGHYVFVRFSFDTQDAMGMNMVTIATEQLVSYIEKETGVTCLSVAGNYDIDKKPAWLNFVENRGMKAWAEVTIPSHVLTDVLHTSAKAVYDVWLAKCMLGSAMAGSMGFNAHFANVIAALFLATGQDIAHVGEGSIGVTTTEIVNGADLYVSVYLPDLMVGTVGGGTNLSTQKEALGLLGIKNSESLAEVAAASVLAGEISLLASLSVGTLGKAHQRLARGKELRTQNSMTSKE